MVAVILRLTQLRAVRAVVWRVVCGGQEAMMVIFRCIVVILITASSVMQQDLAEDA